MTNAKLLKIITITCLLFALLSVNVSAAIPQERPGAFEMVIDVPIRILSLGLTVVGTAFFIVALPFAMSSGSTGDAWDALVVEPFQFTFTRPLGKFENMEELKELYLAVCEMEYFPMECKMTGHFKNDIIKKQKTLIVDTFEILYIQGCGE